MWNLFLEIYRSIKFKSYNRRVSVAVGLVIGRNRWLNSRFLLLKDIGANLLKYNIKNGVKNIDSHRFFTDNVRKNKINLEICDNI